MKFLIRISKDIFSYFFYRSRYFNVRKLKNTNECIVIGNGPSFNTDIKNNQHLINRTNNSFFALNDFCTSDFYTVFKPNYYVIVDPVYFLNDKTLAVEFSDIRNNFFKSLNNKTNWNLTLFIPFNYDVSELIHNTKIKIVKFNRNTSNNKLLKNFFFKKNIIHPSGSNVLISAIYLALQLRFKSINIIGADHSWSKDIRVNNKNEVCIMHQNFYLKKSSLQVWINPETNKPFKMDEILLLLYSMFQGHNEVNSYSKFLNCSIKNLTDKSFIDAYPKKNI